MGEKIAIFKKKEDVLLALGRNDVKVLPEVLQNPAFISAEPQELLGFMAEDGSDYTIIEVKAVKNDPRAFFSLAFGGGVDNGTGHR